MASRSGSMPRGRGLLYWALGLTALVSLAAIGLGIRMLMKSARKPSETRQLQLVLPRGAALVASAVVAPPSASVDAAAVAADTRPLAPGETPLRLRHRPRPTLEAGIGAKLGEGDNAIYIAGLTPGLGAAAAGLNVDDEIVAVDGRPTRGVDFRDVVEWIRGDVDTRVTLMVRAKGANAPKEVVVVRQSLRGTNVSPSASAPPLGPSPLPPGWGKAKPKLSLFTGQPVPPILIDKWMNGAPPLGKTLDGKVLLIDFWATWCTPCRETLPEMAKLAREYENQGLVVVGISLDTDVVELQEFIDQYSFPYSVAWGSWDDMKPLVDGIPTWFLIAPDGVIIMGQAGVDFPGAEIRAQLAKLRKAGALH